MFKNFSYSENVSISYANALFAYCIKNKCLDEGLEDAIAVLSIFSENEKIFIYGFFSKTLQSNVINVFNQLMKNKIFSNFIFFILFQKRKIINLRNILKHFIYLALKNKNCVIAKIFVPKTTVNVDNLVSLVEKIVGSNIAYAVVEDKSILSGAVVVGKGFRVDLSMNKMLKKIGKKISE